VGPFLREKEPTTREKSNQEQRKKNQIIPKAGDPLWEKKKVRTALTNQKRKKKQKGVGPVMRQEKRRKAKKRADGEAGRRGEKPAGACTNRGEKRNRKKEK